MTDSAKGTTKYIVGPVRRFDQKNEMFKRAVWDPSFKELRKKRYGVHYPNNKLGYTHEDLALEQAAWYVERAFGQGNVIHNSGMYSWEQQAVSQVPPDLKVETSDPVELSQHVKKAAVFLGASQAGICQIDRRWIYSHSFNRNTQEHKELELPEECQYAVVLTYEMNYDLIRTSPTWLADAAVGKAYSEMAFTTAMLAQFIRSLGYMAIPSGNDTGISIPLAIDAGLGELGRNGLLITKEFGPRVRIAKVFTDLPLTPDEPIEFGVTEFCSKCGKCAKDCPSQAIMYGERTTQPINLSNVSGELKWPINADQCFKFWAHNESACANCIRTCPFNKPAGWLHDATRSLVNHTSWLDALLIKMDDIFGYGKPVEANRYWNGKK